MFPTPILPAKKRVQAQAPAKKAPPHLFDIEQDLEPEKFQLRKKLTQKFSQLDKSIIDDFLEDYFHKNNWRKEIKTKEEREQREEKPKPPPSPRKKASKGRTTRREREREDD